MQAGLFSAVLTAFVVELYKQLQPDTAEATALLLQQISTQLSLTGTAELQNFKIQVYAGPDATFTPDRAYVTINTTWFAALVFSLLSALIGLVAKQWLRAYITTLSSSPRENVRLRQYRHDGLVRWHVAEIVGSLPILLEIALVLFLYGLLQLLARLNDIVFGIMCAFVAMTFLFYFSTSIIPAMTSGSPFKSPQSLAISALFWRVMRTFRRLNPATQIRVILGETADIEPNVHIPGSWIDQEVESVRLHGDLLESRALARTYKSNLDEDFLDFVTPCLNDLAPEHATSLIFEVIAKKAECSVPTLLRYIRFSEFDSSIVLERFISRAGQRGNTRLVRMMLDVLPRMVHDSGHDSSRVTILDILKTLRKLVTEAERAICELDLHREFLDVLALLLDERGTFHIQRASLHLLWEMTNFGCNMDYCPEGTYYRDRTKHEWNMTNLSHHSPGIGNVIFAARDAFSRHDNDTFVRATNVLLSRLPSAETSEWQGHDWIGRWMQDLESYFRIRNLAMSKYDVNDIKTRWCSGLIAIGCKERNAISEGLVFALEKGVQLGLVDCTPDEAEALNDLKAIYLSGSDRSLRVSLSVHSALDLTSNGSNEEDVVQLPTSKNPLASTQNSQSDTAECLYDSTIAKIVYIRA